jgi:hypothetical protein
MTDTIQPPYIAIRVVYEDMPDLIQIEARVTLDDWSGVARSYTGSQLLRESAGKLATWCQRPVSDFLLQSGADTGIGWLCLRWYPVDKAGHLMCHIQLASSSGESRPEAVRRLSLEMPTEPGLVENFARQLASLAQTLKGEAVLMGIHA